MTATRSSRACHRGMRLWILGLLVVLGAARPASACGFWKLTDHERKLEIGWLINAGTITTSGTTPDGKRRLANLYLDLDAKDGIRVAADKRVVLDIRDGKILRYGKPIGTLGADHVIVLGKHSYAIEFSEPQQETIGQGMILFSWKLAVRRGDDVILESERASALCAPLHRKTPMSDDEQRAEVRRRVIFYLAWREFGV